MGRTVSVKLLADVASFTRNIGGQAVGSVKALSGELDKAARAGKLDRVTTQAAALGVGLVGVAAVAVKMSMDFEKAMSAVSAATHAGRDDLDKLRKAAIQAGQDTQFSATQAAQGVTELAKAGVSTANILGGGLKGALDLAAAGQVEVGEAAETAASAMTQFKLSGDAVPHVADLLAAAAGKAQGSVHDMSAALNQSGLIAAQFGLSIEDTTGALAEFANAGLMGSDAGTSFKTMLLAIANPSKQSKSLMDELNISFYDTQGKFVGVAGTAKVLQDRLSGLTDAQRQQALGQIFGTDAMRAASILYADGAEGVKKWTSAVNDSGYAQETAAKLTDNLSGDLERLKGSLETLAIQSGGGANDGLRKMAQGANFAVDAFSSLPGWVQQTVTVLAGVSGAGLLAGAGLLKARGTAKEFMDQLRDIGPTGARAADGIGKIGSVAGKLSLVGAAAVGVYTGFKLFSDWADRRTAPTRANIDKLTASIKEFASTGEATGELASKYGDNLQKIGQDVKAVTKGMSDLKQAQADVKAGLSDPSIYANWNPVDPQVLQRVKDLDSALTELVKNGGASQARIFLDQLRSSGQLTAAQFQQLTGMLPNYTEAARGAAVANTGLAQGFGTAEANAKAMTGTLDEAVAAGQKLTDVWNQLNGAVLGTDKANLAAKQAIDDVKDSFKANKHAIDGDSEAALKNRIAVGSAAEAAAKAAQAKYEETGSVEQASRAYNGYIDDLKKTLRQSGLTKGQVDKLIAAYGKMPDSVITKVGITGDKAVGNKLLALKAYQDALKSGGGVVAIRKNLSKDNADFLKFETGGRTPSVGIHEPAGVVHGQEFVLDAKTVRNVDRQAPGFLEEVHATHGLPGYAGGGRVVWPYNVNVSKTRIPSRNEVASAVVPAAGSFGSWPSSPSAQRGDSGVWRSVVALIKSTGPISGHFGNAYRPGDPKWHGSGRAVDWMGFNQDRLATFLAARHPLELIHRTNHRDYAYTRGVNKGSFNNALMQAHRNHVHIAMANGGVIREPIVGVGASGATYSFGENGRHETVVPGTAYAGGRMGGGSATQVTINAPITISGSNMSPQQIAIAVNRELGAQIDYFARGAN